MPETRNVPGINIQHPWSELILSGAKKIETRNYPLPPKYLGKVLAVIETPGPIARKQAMKKRAFIAGLVVFGGCYQYRSANHWLKDKQLHLVPADHSQFKFQKNMKKYAWVIESFLRFPSPISAPARRGIVFTKSCAVPINKFCN